MIAETRLQMTRRHLEEAKEDLQIAISTGDKAAIRSLESEVRQWLRKLDKVASEEAKRK